MSTVDNDNKKTIKTANHMTSHLESVDETYFEHMSHALRFSARMFTGSLACLIHGLLPFAFEKTGSKAIAELHDQMVENRKGLSERRRTARVSA